jgi:predicted kinase
MQTKKMIIKYVLGPPGAGKSSFIYRTIKDTTISYLSTDRIRKDRGLSYEDATKIMPKIFEEHLKNRISFIAEGTGQSDELYKIFTEYKRDKMIDFKIMFIDISLADALERNKNRERALDDSIVKDVYDKCMAKRHLWKDFDCEYVNYKDIMVDKQFLDYSKIY